MTPITIASTKLENRLGSLSWLCAGAGALGSLIPGVAYFRAYAPPLLEEVSLLTGGIGFAVVVLGVTRGIPHEKARRRSRWFISFSLFAILAYSILRGYWTVGPPLGWEGPRVQIGFHLAEWSLTSDARKLVHQDQAITPKSLMMKCGGWEEGGVYRAWESWSVTVAGVILIVLFASGFLSWVYGFTLLALSRPPVHAPHSPEAERQHDT